jgi:hypothetical protein
LAGAHAPVGAVDARSDDIDHDLTGSRQRIWLIAISENLRSAEPIDENRFHEISSRAAGNVARTRLHHAIKAA